MSRPIQDRFRTRRAGARPRGIALVLLAALAAAAAGPPGAATAEAPAPEAASASNGHEYRLLSSIPGQASEVGEAAEAEEPEQLEPTRERPAAASTAPAAQEAAGHAGYRLDAVRSFDRFANRGAWIQAHFDVIKAYPTFGDVYVQYGKPVIGYHDPATEGFAPLNQSQIEAFVAKVKRDMGLGYAGVFVDDANWSFSPSPGPEANLANLLEAIRKAEPGALIEINSQYHDMWPKMKAGDASVTRALAQVNLVTKEFGVGPTSLINTAQDYAEYMTYADTLRAKGMHVVMTGDPNSSRVPTMEYNLATCLLINDGKDFVNAARQKSRFWRGFAVNLGAPLGGRERSSSGVWSRRFAGGLVYTVEPGAAAQTINLPKRMRSAEWGKVSAVTLAPEQGAVLAG
jgi:hypothetical protein